MKKFIILLLAITLSACGKSNKVNTGETSGTSGLEIYSTALSNFEGNYDLIKMGSEDCGASIQIVRDCDGLKLLSNHLGPEEFCNINKGEMRSTTVTLNGNELKSVLNIVENNRDSRDNRDGEYGRRDPRIPQNKMSYTNTLTLNSDRTLVKVSNLKSRMSRCVYLKR